MSTRSRVEISDVITTRIMSLLVDFLLIINFSLENNVEFEVLKRFEGVTLGDRDGPNSADVVDSSVIDVLTSLVGRAQLVSPIWHVATT